MEMNLDSWNCSSPYILSLGCEDSYHCVHQELLLLHNYFFFYHFKIGSQKENAFRFLSVFWKLRQDDLNVRRTSLVCQKLQHIPSSSFPSCSFSPLYPGPGFLSHMLCSDNEDHLLCPAEIISLCFGIYRGPRKTSDLSITSSTVFSIWEYTISWKLT